MWQPIPLEAITLGERVRALQIASRPCPEDPEYFRRFAWRVLRSVQMQGAPTHTGPSCPVVPLPPRRRLRPIDGDAA
jgi:hypothetical protein